MQAYQENAPECLTMVHYTELKEDLGIVLMKGDYDPKIIVSSQYYYIYIYIFFFLNRNGNFQIQVKKLT